MRKQFFYNNNQTQSKKVRKTLKQKWTKAVCIGTLSATVLTGMPVIPVITAYAQETALALEENSKTYDLQDPELLTPKNISDYYGNKYQTTVIEINITEDGTYTITGTNEVNGAYMDVHITVEDGVKANIILDNVDIKNDDLYDLDMKGCASSDEREPMFPFMDVIGTVNLYLKGENTITTPYRNTYLSKTSGTIFQLYGQLTIREAEGAADGSLKVNNAKKLIASSGSNNDFQDGTFMMESGTVNADGARMEGVNRFFMTGGKLSCAQISASNLKSCYCFQGGKIDAILSLNEDILIAGTELTNTIWCDAIDDCGYKVSRQTVSDLPAEKKVTAINGCPVSMMETKADGTLTTYLRQEKNNVIQVEGTSYLYTYDTTNKCLNKDDGAELCKVQFVVKEENTEKAYRNVNVQKGTEFGNLFKDARYTYEYQTADGIEFTPETTISSDITVTMIPSVRKYDVEIDGTMQQMAYGSSLPAGKIYYSENGRCCYYGDSPVIRDMKLQSLEMITDANGVQYAKISNKEEFMLFGKMIQADNHINGWLTQDIDMEKESLYYSDLTYNGIWEGNGHTISNITSASYGAGGVFCYTLQGTIRNVSFEQVEICEGVSSSQGGICAINRGTIENCRVIGTKAKVTSNYTTDPYQPIGSIAGVNLDTIKNCFTAKSQIDTSALPDNWEENEIVYSIARNYGTVENTYYEADRDAEAEKTEKCAGIARTAERLASGEVCYLLNNQVSDGTQVWYQKLSGTDADAYPTLKKTAENTVYDGYDGCEKAYTNEKDTIPVHDMTFTAAENTITATCERDAAHQAQETITAQNAVYNKKEHVAALTHTAEWEEYELQTGTIQYLRDGKATTDLISAGAITAVVKQGGVQAQIQYTIAKADVPETAPKAEAKVPYTQKKITEDVLGADNNWKISNEDIGKDIPENGSIKIKAMYVGEDAQNYEHTEIEIEVTRSSCDHKLDKVDAVAPTADSTGNKEYYVCKECGKYFEDAQGTKEITKESTVIPKTQPSAVPSAKPSVTPPASKPSTAPATMPTQIQNQVPSPAKKLEETVQSPNVMPGLIQPIVSKKATQKVSWKKVKGADGYLIYASKCSEGDDIRKLQLIKTISSAKVTSYVNKNLEKDTWYKYEVRAYRIVDGKKVAFGRSLQLHALTKGGKEYANPSEVRVKKKKLTLKAGTSKKMNAKVVLPKGKKCQWHIDKLRYIVSDASVLSVSEKGKITAKKAGKATIYAVAQNGKMAKVKVTVTKK